MNLKNKTVVVTGGGGFVGSHVVDRVIKEDPEELIVLTTYFLGKKQNLSEATKNFPEIKIMEVDVTREDEMEKVFKKDIDIVFHLAVIPLPVSFSKPEWTFIQNVKMTSVICELARHRFKTLINFSSSEAYGSASYTPMDEKHPLNPSTPYAASKAASDLLIQSYIKTFGIDSSTIRPFNIYGPRQNAGQYAGIVPLTIKRAINNEEITIFGDGEQTRDFIYVTDVADAAVKIYKEKSTRGKVINIAGENEISINRLIKLIFNHFNNYKKEIKHLPPRPGDVKRHRADTSLARKLIDFKPTVNIEDGIKRTVQWYKENLKYE